MSAYISVIGKEAAYLFSDGAAYDSHGIVKEFVCKTTSSKTEPFAVTTLGNHFIGQHIQPFLAESAEKWGVDEFFDGFLPVFLDEMKAKRILFTADDGSGCTGVHIVAWSERKGFIHGGFQTVDEPTRDEEDAVESFKFQLVKGNIAARGPVFDQSKFATLRPPTNAQTEEEVIRYVGSSGMEFMREVKGRSMHLKGVDGFADHYLVGGHVDMTKITPTGATTKRIKVWDDKIGQLIQPKIDRSNLAEFPARSRQQRRAADRALRHAAG